MKKILAVILSVVMLSALSLSCFAADGPAISFEADKTEVKVGDEVVFTVKIENNTFIDTMVLTVSAPAALKFLKAEKTEAVATFTAGANLLFEGVTGNGAIAKLTYKVNDTAAAGAELKLGCTVKECYDSSLNDIVVTKKDVPASTIKVEGAPAPIIGAGSITVVAAAAEAIPEDTISFDLVLADNTGIDTMIINVVNPTNAEFVSAVKGDIVATMTAGAKYVFEGITGDGAILTLTYKVAADAADGDKVAVNFTVEECYDTALNDITLDKNADAYTLIKVEAVCAHTETEIKDAVDATCTEAGYTGDTYCKDCGEKIADGEAIPALGHDFAEDAATAKEATCTEAGKAADKKCSRCDAVEAGAAIAALGHDYKVDAATAKAATCTEAGKEADEKCTRCGDVKAGAAIAALGHGATEIKGAVQATTKSEGYTGDTYCTVCGAKLADGTKIPAVSPQTGDNATLWIVITAVSGICLLGALSLKKKEN